MRLGMKRNNILLKGNTTDNDFYNKATMRLRTNKKDLCNEFNIPEHNFLYIDLTGHNLFRSLCRKRSGPGSGTGLP